MAVTKKRVEQAKEEAQRAESNASNSSDSNNSQPMTDEDPLTKPKSKSAQYSENSQTTKKFCSTLFNLLQVN